MHAHWNEGKKTKEQKLSPPKLNFNEIVTFFLFKEFKIPPQQNVDSDIGTQKFLVY